MVKDYLDSERGNPLPPNGLLFPISSKGLLYAPPDRQDTPVVEQWLEREIAQLVHHEGSIQRLTQRSYHGATSRSLFECVCVCVCACV